MGFHQTRDLVEEFEQGAMRQRTQRVILRLYITGMSPCSTEAIARVRVFCETYLAPDCYELEIIDLRQHPELAAEEQILAVPTLTKILPLPLRRLVGSLTNPEQVLTRLDLT